MAEGTSRRNFWFNIGCENLYIQSRDTFNVTIRYYFQEYSKETILHSRVAILALAITTLLNFLQVKYQGKDESPFETHPKVTLLAIISLLLYCFSFDAKLRISSHNIYYSSLVHISMAFFGPLSLASLCSILFPESFCSFFFSTSILFSMCQQPLSHAQKLWNWLKEFLYQQRRTRTRRVLSVHLPWFQRNAITVHSDVLPV